MDLFDNRFGILLKFILAVTFFSWLQSPVYAQEESICQVITANHYSVSVLLYSNEGDVTWGVQSDVGFVHRPAVSSQTSPHSNARVDIDGLVESQTVNVSVDVLKNDSLLETIHCSGTTWKGWIWDSSSQPPVPKSDGFTWQLYPWTPGILLDINLGPVLKYDYSSNDYSYPLEKYTVPVLNENIQITMSADGLLSVTGAPPNSDVNFTITGDNRRGNNSMAYVMDVVTSMLPGISPHLANLKSEVSGCSFDITNYDPNFTYYFKHSDSDVSISPSGHVKLTGQAEGASQLDYPSSKRNDYQIVNNVSEQFVCKALDAQSIQEEIQLDAQARERAEKEQIRTSAVQKLSSTENVSSLSPVDFIDAGVSNFTPEIFLSLSDYVSNLPKSTLVDISQLNQVAQKLNWQHFFVGSKDPLNRTTAEYFKAGFQNMGTQILSRINRFLSSSSQSGSVNFDDIQLEINKQVILERARNGTHLKESELPLLGIGYLDSRFAKQVMIQLRRLPASSFDSVSALQQKIDDIQKSLESKAQYHLMLMQRVADRKR